MGGDAKLSDSKLSSRGGELVLEELFLEFEEECARLEGGCYRKGYIPIEEMSAVTPDMEAIVDEMRGKSVPAEDLEDLEELEVRGKWYYFRPKQRDLTPFYEIMAPTDDDFMHPGFSSPLLGRVYKKITYHRGGRMVLMKKEVFP